MKASSVLVLTDGADVKLSAATASKAPSAPSSMAR